MTLQSSRTVIDTAAFFALLSPSDVFHSLAINTYVGLIDSDQELWTTSYVLVEAQALIHRRLGFAQVELLIQTLADTVAMFWIDQGMHESAWESFLASRGRGLSFVDWTTALVARQLGADVFTFDKGFLGAGIRVVPRLP